MVVAAIAASLSPAERVLLFRVGSGGQWARLPHGTIQHMMIRNLVERGPAGRLMLTDRARAVFEALIRTAE
jgi:hypothetical protein